MASPARHAFFPGSFDPVTIGHVDLVRRALALFGRVTIGVAANSDKRALFEPGERVELLRRSLAGLSNVDATLVHGLTVDACREFGCDVLVRGVRSGSDFDYEWPMARTNRELAPAIDTVLLIPSGPFAHISSSLVRQIALAGGDASSFVPAPVAEALRARVSSPRS